MVPSFTRVALTFKDLIEKKINVGESSINLSSYISKATLDVIGLVGKILFFFNVRYFLFYAYFNFFKNLSLISGFDYEFNSLTTKNELAEAYGFVMKPTALGFGLNLLAGYFPYTRKIPIQVNKNFNSACEVIDRVSKKLVEDKYKNIKSDGKDLLSILININKTLPVEEKLSDDELKYQVIFFKKKNILLYWPKLSLFILYFVCFRL